MNSATFGNSSYVKIKSKKKSKYYDIEIMNNEISENEVINFKNPEHNSILMNSFISMKRTKELCDVQLIVDDQVIQCHKIILASLSPYFRTMFTNGMFESKSHIIQLNDISFKIVNQLIDEYFYSGFLTIEKHNVEHLFNVASLFQISCVINACCEFFKRNMTSFNCLEIMELAEMHSCSNIYEFSLNYAATCLDYLIEHKSLESISINNLVAILEKRDMFKDCLSEEKLFNGIIQWTKYDFLTRKTYLPQMITYIRIESFSKDFLIDKVAREEILRNNVECSQFVLRAVEQFLNPHSITNVKSSKIFSYFKKTLGNVPDIMVVGGFSKNDVSRTAESFVTKQDKWSSIASMINSRWGAGLTYCSNYIYVCGGSNDTGRLASMERYDICTNVWLPAPNLLTARNGVSLTTVFDTMYAIGGFDGFNPLKTVEIYSPKVGKWYYSTDLTIPRFSHASTSFNNKIYCAGGSDGHVLNCFEYFDPVNNKWINKSPMNTARKQLALVATEEYIYAIGGFGVNKRLNTVERYCPKEDKWIFVNPMSRNLSGCSACYNGGFIYVFGGHDDSNVLSSVDRYDPVSDTWLQCLPMLNQRDRLASAVINL